MKILITGGLGVNGSWVTRKLVQGGHDVSVVDVRLDTNLVPDVAADISLHEGDVRDLEMLSALLDGGGFDRVVHMAGLVEGFQAEQRLAFEINAMGTVNVLEAARLAAVPRVVFASSRAVYGSAVGAHAHPTYLPFSETDPVRPVLVYETCKVAAELMGENYAREGLQFAALRFAHIIGPGKTLRYAQHGVWSRLIDDPLAGRSVTVPRGGEQRDDVIYADDMAQGVVAATLHDQAGARAYNISRGEAVTLNDLADAVRRHLPEAEIEIGPGLNPFGSGQLWYGPLDNSRARAELGFLPRFDLDGMVADYAQTIELLGLRTLAGSE